MMKPTKPWFSDGPLTIGRASQSRYADPRRTISSPGAINSKKRKASEAGVEARCVNPPKISKKDSSSESHSGAEKKPHVRRQVFLPADSAEFCVKYDQQEELGSGGYGSVFAGVRRSDQLPVAIKHIPTEKVDFLTMPLRGRMFSVPKEVLLMGVAGSHSDSVGQNPSVSLLDCYRLEDEVVIVMERPTPAQDLLNYCFKHGPLTEQCAKNIAAQLVDAVVNLHKKKIFHRDLKLENILIQGTESGPRVRIIDFGCGTIDRHDSYSTFHGTPCFAPPEFLSTGKYFASPTSVWQIGVVLYELLSSKSAKMFSTEALMRGELYCPNGLSQECEEFLKACLTVDPDQRATLEQLQLHSWLQC